MQNIVLRRLPDLNVAQLDRLEKLGREAGRFHLDPELAAAVERAHAALAPMEVVAIYSEVAAGVRHLPIPGWYRNIGQAVIAAAALAVQAWARIDEADARELMRRWTEVMGNREQASVRRVQQSPAGVRARMIHALAEWD